MLFPARALCHFRLPAAWKQILPGEEQSEPPPLPRIQGSSQAGLFLPGNTSPPSTPRSLSPPAPSHPTSSQALGFITGNHQAGIPCVTLGTGPGSPGTRAEGRQGPPHAQPPTEASIIPYPSHQSDLESREPKEKPSRGSL